MMDFGSNQGLVVDATGVGDQFPSDPYIAPRILRPTGAGLDRPNGTVPVSHPRPEALVLAARAPPRSDPAEARAGPFRVVKPRGSHPVGRNPQQNDMRAP